MADPLVSVVILNWNGADHIHKCIESVLQQDYASVELIIVDNASSDGSFEAVRKNHPDLIYKKNDENLFFAKGMNSGLSLTTGRYVMPLNLDAYLPENYLTRAVRLMETEPTLGAIGGTEYKWEDGVLTDKRNETTGPVYMRRWVQFRSIRDHSPQYPLGIIGSFPLIRAEALAECKAVTGYHYDPRYIHGWEDTDLWFRLHWLGWKIKYEPKLKAWHVKSASVENKKRLLDKSQFHQRMIFRNRRFLIEKCLSEEVLSSTRAARWMLASAFPLYLLIKNPRSVRSWYQAKNDVKAIAAELKEERQKIREAQKVDGRYFLQFLK